MSEQLIPPMERTTRTGALYYRCRLCGMITERGFVFYEAVPDVARALRLMNNDPTSHHECADGRIGVHDLAGGKEIA